MRVHLVFCDRIESEVSVLFSVSRVSVLRLFPLPLPLSAFRLLARCGDLTMTSSMSETNEQKNQPGRKVRRRLLRTKDISEYNETGLLVRRIVLPRRSRTMSSKDGVLAVFMEVANCDQDTASRYLSGHNFNLEVRIHMFCSLVTEFCSVHYFPSFRIRKSIVLTVPIDYPGKHRSKVKLHLTLLFARF